MPKHTHLETDQEQRVNKEQGKTSFYYDPHQSSGSVKPEVIPINVAKDDSDIKLRAYQIHLEKGGSDLDNWLEAERSLKNAQLK